MRGLPEIVFVSPSRNVTAFMVQRKRKENIEWYLSTKHLSVVHKEKNACITSLKVRPKFDARLGFFVVYTKSEERENDAVRPLKTGGYILLADGTFARKLSTRYPSMGR